MREISNCTTKCEFTVLVLPHCSIAQNRGHNNGLVSIKRIPPLKIVSSQSVAIHLVSNATKCNVGGNDTFLMQSNLPWTGHAEMIIAEK